MYWNVVRDKDIYPIATVVRIKKTGEMALIKQHTFLTGDRNFLNYLAEIEGRGQGKLWAVYHENVELECLPIESPTIKTPC